MVVTVHVMELLVTALLVPGRLERLMMAVTAFEVVLWVVLAVRQMSWAAVTVRVMKQLVVVAPTVYVEGLMITVTAFD